jgi:hypothetical protein
VSVDDVLDDGEAEAGAAGRPRTAAVHPVEALGQARDVLARDARAVVGDGQRHAGAPARLGPPAFEAGVIAGCRSVEPHLARYIPGPSDGKVAVARTRLEGMRDFLVVERSHPFAMRAPEVIEAVFRFLEQGHFR